MNGIEPLVLTGDSLTLDQIVDVARNGREVVIGPGVAERLRAGRELVYELSDRGVPIYGCNTGVGWNKDVPITPEFLAAFNRNLLHSHAIGVGPPASEAETRAALLIRLNTLLVGCTGLSEHIPRMYGEFLNRGIHPLIPERGSVGQADIGCLAHTGLAFIGVGRVRYRGRRYRRKRLWRPRASPPWSWGPRTAWPSCPPTPWARARRPWPWRRQRH